MNRGEETLFYFDIFEEESAKDPQRQRTPSGIIRILVASAFGIVQLQG
jgi:hypothetical protein